jgi:hypothetical protein
MKKILLLSISLFLTACMSTGPKQLSSDTYFISIQDSSEIYGSVKRLKQEAIKQANKFAQTKGKEAVVISFVEKPKGFEIPADWAQVDYTFSLRALNATTAKIPEPRTQPEREEMPVKPAQMHHQTKTKHGVSAQHQVVNHGKVDYYTELKKLKELLDEKIINQDEFELLKKKLLSQ